VELYLCCPPYSFMTGYYGTNLEAKGDGYILVIDPDTRFDIRAKVL